MEFFISEAESFVQHHCYLNKYQKKLSRHSLGKLGFEAQLLKAEIHCTSFLDSIFLAVLDQLWILVSDEKDWLAKVKTEHMLGEEDHV